MKKRKSKQQSSKPTSATYGGPTDTQTVNEWCSKGNEAYDPDGDVQTDAQVLRDGGLSEEKVQAFVDGWLEAKDEDNE